jgi:acyl-CoA dehydrogenase
MVNFSPSEEQELLRQTLADFAREVLRPRLRTSDEQNAVPADLPAKGWELGLVQESIPEAFGGFGGTRSALTGTLMLVAGTEEQRAAWLPRFAGANFTAGTAAVVEPRWDFDAAHPATRAERSNGDWVLSGQKCFAPLANQAEVTLVYASAPDGLAAFLGERGAKGLAVGDREQNMGLKALDTFPVRLDGVRVPASARLGGDGANLQPLLDASRVASAAAAVGVGRAAFDYAREYAKERKAFGVAIAQKQAIAFMLSNMAIEIDSIRLLTWEAAWRLDQGKPATREAYLARQYAADQVLKIADNALQVLGGHGYIRDHLFELFLRDARGFAVIDGIAIV